MLSPMAKTGQLLTVAVLSRGSYAKSTLWRSAAIENHENIR
jgi:hypothetical protein